MNNFLIVLIAHSGFLCWWTYPFPLKNILKTAKYVAGLSRLAMKPAMTKWFDLKQALPEFF